MAGTVYVCASINRSGTMRTTVTFVLVTGLAAFAMQANAGSPDAATKAEAPKAEAPKAQAQKFSVEQQSSHGSVSIGGRRIDYEAVAGTLVVHTKDWDDVPQNADPDAKEPPPEASMFYVAYFAAGDRKTPRPITFFYNGGPGSSTVWLHMGAFGPRRIVTRDDTHTPAAPYSVVNNEYSLLDASDLVFIDAPGTGFSRIAGKDHDKAFFGVDPDAHAFADFITQFLSKYSRWNSPKYIFGESYGTTRSAVLANLLSSGYDVDLNGVILLSQILAFDNSVDGPEFNPGVDLPYQLALPTYAATAWYHHKLPGAARELPALLAEVEHFAMHDYAEALQQGNELPAERRAAIAQQLHQYTGLPADYIEKANLRITGGVFEKALQDDAGLTTGRLDARFSGPTFDPLGKEAAYDPQSAAISSAYVSAFNDYVRTELKVSVERAFKPEIDIWRTWNFLHQAPGAPVPLPQAANVMPDLAAAMKYNPDLKVLVTGGYYDIATPYYAARYEMRQLPIPASLSKNIEFRFYESGHMIYAHEPAARKLHEDVADFIRRSDNLAAH
jgi:carboxypeptidase C (cathepsin A)